MVSQELLEERKPYLIRTTEKENSAALNIYDQSLLILSLRFSAQVPKRDYVCNDSVLLRSQIEYQYIAIVASHNCLSVRFLIGTANLFKTPFLKFYIGGL